LVTDPSGAVVPNAGVTATQSSTNLEQKTTTDSAGYYLFPALLVGSYTVTVEGLGFKKAIHENVILGVGQRARSDFTLSEQSHLCQATQRDAVCAEVLLLAKYKLRVSGNRGLLQRQARRHRGVPCTFEA